MIVYKMTDENGRTFGGTEWPLSIWKETDGLGDLCGPGWLHHYSDPLLAVLLNPIHAAFPSPRLWEAEAEGVIRDDRGLKLGSTRLRIIRELPLPAVTTAQRVRFAILCAQKVCHDTAWRAWADGWLSGADRTAESAAAAREAAWQVEGRAEWEAANAARAAAWAAAAAGWAAAGEVEGKAEPAVVAVVAARAAAGATLDLPALARQAIAEEPTP